MFGLEGKVAAIVGAASGIGEAVAIGSTAAVRNALTDALGVVDVPMPASPETVWRAMEGE